MSDFDREAEREKLREKFERDKEKRQASERMSELLLQGATMTNRHCKECHSPVFRYDGDEFCPTCQQVVDENGNFVGPAAGEDAAEGGEADETADAAAANGQQPDAEADAEAAEDRPAPGKPTAGTEPQTEPQPTEPAERVEEPTAEEPRSATEPDPRAGTPSEAPTDPRPARVDPPARREEASGREGRERTEGGDLGAAEAALAREIAALTRQAEEARDVGRKRDLFAAAREAAETLQTVRRL
jgi:uncharacterized Zn finger protein (UPF0148 family)